MSDQFVETWIDDGEACCKIQWTEDRKEVFIHYGLDIPLTPSIVKKHRTQLEEVCKKLNDMGYKQVYAYSPCQSTTWKKLCRMFGFKETTNPVGVTIFVKETTSCQ